MEGPVQLDREVAARYVSDPMGGIVRVIMTLDCPVEWVWLRWRESLFEGKLFGWQDFLVEHAQSFSLIDAVTLWDSVAPAGSLDLAARLGPEDTRTSTTAVTVCSPMTLSLPDPASRAQLQAMSDLECMLQPLLYRWTSFWVRSRTGLDESDFGSELRDFLLERRKSRPCYELAQSYEERVEVERVGLFDRLSVHHVIELTDRWSNDVRTLLSGRVFRPSARTARFLSGYLIGLGRTRQRLLLEGEGAILFPSTGFLNGVLLDGQIFPIARLLADLFIDRFTCGGEGTPPAAMRR